MLRITVAFLFLICCSYHAIQSQVTWSDQIATIIYDNCSSCHHSEGIAPFNLLSYDETAYWADEIHHAIEERSMPPWPADPNYRHFVGEAYLEQEEIDLIHDWIFNGMPYGNEDLEPEAPTFPPQGSLLDEIDFTVAIEPYTLQTNTDEYRWFVIENPFDEPVYISQLEVMAGLEEVVHHADLFYDLSGSSMVYDQSDPLSGFNGSTGYPNNDYYINAWQPGGNIATYPKDWGIMVPPEADFVVEIHYGPGGIGLTDSTYMNLKFVENPTDVRQVRAAWLLSDTAPVLIDGPLAIPANEVVTFHQVGNPIPSDLSIISICPHMHGLGKSYKVWFESPAGDSIPLIDIPHWDFHWQKYYTFQQIQKIPQGSILKSEGVYDNTVNNHDNPNSPPIDVYKGLATEDEMFLCYFIYADYEQGDEDIILDSLLLNPPVVVDTMEVIMDTTVSGLPNQPSLGWAIYPNPSRDKITLVGQLSKQSKLQFRILDVEGTVYLQEIRESSQEIRQETFNILDLPLGIYFLEWWDNEARGVVEFVKR